MNEIANSKNPLTWDVDAIAEAIIETFSR